MRLAPLLYRLVVFGLWLPAACGDSDLVAPGALESVTAPVDAPPGAGSLRLATLAMPVARDKGANLARMEAEVDALVTRDAGIDLVHFGEATLGWYETASNPQAYQRSIAEPLTGAAVTRLRSLARRHGIYLAWGMIESAGGRLYSSLVVADRQGEIMAVHRKMLLFEADERAGITEAAPNAQIIDIDGLRVGLMVCFDGKSEWLQRELTGGGADLVLLSIASDMPEADVSPTARRLGAWVSVANRYGDEDGFSYSGNAYISDPYGTVRAETHGGAGQATFNVGTAP